MLYSVCHILVVFSFFVNNFLHRFQITVILPQMKHNFNRISLISWWLLWTLKFYPPAMATSRWYGSNARSIWDDMPQRTVVLYFNQFGQLVEHLGFLKESDVDSKTFLEALKAINIFEIALNLCFIALKIGNLKPV